MESAALPHRLRSTLKQLEMAVSDYERCGDFENRNLLNHLHHIIHILVRNSKRVQKLLRTAKADQDNVEAMMSKMLQADYNELELPMDSDGVPNSTFIMQRVRQLLDIIFVGSGSDLILDLQSLRSSLPVDLKAAVAPIKHYAEWETKAVLNLVRQVSEASEEVERIGSARCALDDDDADADFPDDASSATFDSDEDMAFAVEDAHKDAHAIELDEVAAMCGKDRNTDPYTSLSTSYALENQARSFIEQIHEKEESYQVEISELQKQIRDLEEQQAAWVASTSSKVLDYLPVTSHSTFIALDDQARDFVEQLHQQEERHRAEVFELQGQVCDMEDQQAVLRSAKADLEEEIVDLRGKVEILEEKQAAMLEDRASMQKRAIDGMSMDEHIAIMTEKLESLQRDCDARTELWKREWATVDTVMMER